VHDRQDWPAAETEATITIPSNSQRLFGSNAQG
jgi:hypothetical protein